VKNNTVRLLLLNFLKLIIIIYYESDFILKLINCSFMSNSS